MKMEFLARLIAIAGLAIALPTSAHAQSIEALRQLITDGRHQRAYEMGQGMGDRLGDPEFDLYYGVAAISSGASADGVLALERVVLADPDNRTARHVLARGYFSLGENTRARQEFEELLAGAAPDEAKAIEAHLDAIREREASYRSHFSAQAEFGVGRDSNINSGLKPGGSIDIPGYGTFPVPDSNSISVAEADSFTVMSGTLALAHPTGPGQSLLFNLSAEDRKHADSNNDQFDQRSAGAAAAIAQLSEKSLYRLTLGANRNWLGGTGYGTTTGASGEWSYQPDARHRFALTLQLTKLKYEDIEIFLTKDRSLPPSKIAASERDTRLAAVAMRWTTAMPNYWQTVVGSTVTLADEANLKGHDELSRMLLGWKLDLTATPVTSWSTGLGLGYTAARNKADVSVSKQKRRDFTSSFDAFVGYAFNRNWGARAEYQFIEQDSNNGLFDFDRSIIQAKVQYQFR